MFFFSFPRDIFRREKEKKIIVFPGTRRVLKFPLVLRLVMSHLKLYSFTAYYLHHHGTGDLNKPFMNFFFYEILSYKYIALENSANKMHTLIV